MPPAAAMTAHSRYSDWFDEPDVELEDEEHAGWKVWQYADAGQGMRFLHLANDVVVVAWSPQRSDREVRERFERLASTWLRETKRVSSLQVKCLHPAYQEIIGLGPQAVPHIIRALQERPGHWFWALRSIVGVDHAEGSTTIAEAADRWIDWFRSRT